MNLRARERGEPLALRWSDIELTPPPAQPRFCAYSRVRVRLTCGLPQFRSGGGSAQGDVPSSGVVPAVDRRVAQDVGGHRATVSET